MKRRDFLAASAVLPLLASSPAFAAKKTPAKATPVKTTPAKPARSPAAEAPDEPRNALSLPDEPLPQWRTYDIASTIALKEVEGQATRVWLPLAQYKDTPWQRSLGHRWQGNFENAGIYRDPVAEMEVFYADWKASAGEPRLHIVSQVATQDRHFDITRRITTVERNEVLRRCLQSSAQVPNDGLVRRTAERIVGRIKDPVAQGKAIYDWVVENADYNPAQPGFGGGNIGAMLDSGRLVGKSADIALLFVALCRGMGLPARPVYGLRVDYSRLFGGLGVAVAGADLSQAQHCRAEFYAPGYGWIPVDPSDVRKASLDERLSNGDPKRVVLKKLLFGFWEMNWISLNAAQDVELRGTAGKPVPALLLPHAETAAGRFDSQDTERLSYKVSARRVDG